MNILKLLNSVRQKPESGKDSQSNTTFKIGDRKTPEQIEIIALKLMVASILDSLSASDLETIVRDFQKRVRDSGLLVDEQ